MRLPFFESIRPGSCRPVPGSCRASTRTGKPGRRTAPWDDGDDGVLGAGSLAAGTGFRTDLPKPSAGSLLQSAVAWPAKSPPRFDSSPPEALWWKKGRQPYKPVKHRGQTVQNDDIQEQFNDAVAAGDRRLAERIARIWLLRLQTVATMPRKSPAPLPML